MASTTSPFKVVENELPWILWQENHDILHLHEQKETECRSVTGESQKPYAALTEKITPPASFSVQRKQYNAVLSRMQQAHIKAGKYSAWNG